VPNFVRFDAGMLKLQQMIKWDVFLGHGVYTLWGIKTRQNVFHHNFHKTRPILKKFGGLLLKQIFHKAMQTLLTYGSGCYGYGRLQTIVYKQFLTKIINSESHMV